LREDVRRVRINQPNFNKRFRYANNSITTSNYSFWNFIPKNLFEQFQNMANLYFLFMLILQLIPIVSSLDPFSTLLPLLVVVILKALKDLNDDIKRHINDYYLNSQPVQILNGNVLEDRKWRNIIVGNVVLLKNNDCVPVN
ncbi:unnamed protein product, partial [Brachionus calyciflorus]